MGQGRTLKMSQRMADRVILCAWKRKYASRPIYLKLLYDFTLTGCMSIKLDRPRFPEKEPLTHKRPKKQPPIIMNFPWVNCLHNAPGTLPIQASLDQRAMSPRYLTDSDTISIQNERKYPWRWRAPPGYSLWSDCQAHRNGIRKNFIIMIQCGPSPQHTLPVLPCDIRRNQSIDPSVLGPILYRKFYRLITYQVHRFSFDAINSFFKEHSLNLAWVK